MNKNYERIERFIQPLLFLLFSIELVWTKSRSGIYSGIVFIGLYFVTYAFFKLKSPRSLTPLVVCWLLFVVMALAPVWTKYVSIDVGAQGVTVIPDNLNQPPGALPAPGVPGTGPIPPPPGQQTRPRADQPLAETANLATDSIVIRKLVWQGAVKLGLKYPLFGTGVETFAYAYNFTRPAAHNQTSEWDFVYNKAHNELLNYFANTGFFGLFSYLLLFGAFLIPAVKILYIVSFPPRNGVRGKLRRESSS
ncbi:MAG: O-antigen ligase family protein, partial [Patescibacteria group bacterium]